jgi:DNA-binding NarL/FixJ family response regulator
VITVNTQDQAVVHASQAQPYLVILMGNRLNRAQSFIDQLRKTVNNRCITIVALTDVHAPSWLHQEENPGFDGFLVKPISGDVLSSLVQSAWARQAFSSAC